MKTKMKFFIKAVLLVFVFCGLNPSGAGLMSTNYATAQTSGADTAAADLNAQKNEKQKKLDEINKQIKELTGQINETRQKSNTLKNEVSIYDKQILSTQLQILANETQIDDTNLQIAELEKLIAEKTEEISQNKKVLSQLLIQLKEYDDQYYLRILFSSKNLSEFLDQVEYTSSFQNKIYQLLQKIKELKEKLETQQAELKIKLQVLIQLKEQLEIAEQDISIQREQRQSLLNQTRGLERNFQALLSNSKKEEANIEKEIEDLDAKIRAKLGAKSTPQGKGILAWPMDGVLTQKYGNTGFTALGYNFHNGIDIAAPAGKPIYAAADGTVTYTDYSDAAYGNWASVKHSLQGKNGLVNIITVYGHMRTIKVKAGQKVAQGDLIGYEGNSGNTTKKLYGPERGYHIHFGVYDVEGFGVSPGQYSKTYGAYLVPFGYTYNPLSFLE